MAGGSHPFSKDAILGWGTVLVLETGKRGSGLVTEPSVADNVVMAKWTIPWNHGPFCEKGKGAVKRYYIDSLMIKPRQKGQLAKYLSGEPVKGGLWAKYMNQSPRYHCRSWMEPTRGIDKCDGEMRFKEKSSYSSENGIIVIKIGPASCEGKGLHKLMKEE